MNEIAKALEALDRIFNYCEEIDLHIPKEEQTGYDMLVDINIIREALVNQKTGHWIDDNDGYGTSCSECGKWYTHPYLAKEEIIYCCRCGAKMEGEQE